MTTYIKYTAYFTKKRLLVSFLSLFIILSFTLPLNPTQQSGWYQQSLPDLGGRQIKDLTFTDSLNGYVITNRLSTTDTSFILKTNNGGDNWTKVHAETTNSLLLKIKFINQNTGFVGGLIDFNYILKTTNAGNNWHYINAIYNTAAIDMFVLNQDTIWIVDDIPLGGGVFRTTNGGQNWTIQYSGATAHIYFYNARIGFMDGNGGLKKTTNSGQTWTSIPGEGEFTDMYFADSLTGWYCNWVVKKTTNGGLNWQQQILPSGGNIALNSMLKISGLNKDTLWGTGGVSTYLGGRGLLFRTTNSGLNWLFQIPEDTSIHIIRYYFINFINKKTGWAYSGNIGIHTTTGGENIFYTGIDKKNNYITYIFELFQNYPNPFNPATSINYYIYKRSHVQLIIYEITGKIVEELVNQEQNEGIYETEFNAKGLPSGVYFYKIIVSLGKEMFTDTKKMLLIK